MGFNDPLNHGHLGLLPLEVIKSGEFAPSGH